MIAAGPLAGLVAALGYAASMLLVKRAYQGGIRPYQYLIAASFFQLIIYGVILGFAEFPGDFSEMGLLILGAFVFIGAQALTVLAVYHGDASIQTPVMGAKVIFVSLLNVSVLSASLTTDMWIGTIGAATAVFLLGWSRRSGGHPTLPGVLLALGSALLFACSDILIVYASEGLDPLFVVSFIMASSALVMLLSLPFVKSSHFRIPRGALPWLLSGSAVFVGQTVIFGLALAFFRTPTLINIMFSTRGIWSLVLLLLFGQLIGIHEAGIERGATTLRVLGAIVMTVAVVVVLT